MNLNMDSINRKHTTTACTNTYHVACSRYAYSFCIMFSTHVCYIVFTPKCNSYNSSTCTTYIFNIDYSTCRLNQWDYFKCSNRKPFFIFNRFK